MASFNAPNTDALGSSVTAEHFDRSSTATTFIVPSTTSSVQLESFVSTTPHFVASVPIGSSTRSAQHHQQTNSTSSSYTFVQIKREPCQVSEVTTSNSCNQQQQHSSTSSLSTTTSIGVGSASSSITASTTSKTLSSTLTTLVKIEASSPKVMEVDKAPATNLSATSASVGSTNSVPIGIAVARKRPQESSLNSSSTIPMQQGLNKDMNCFGIRVTDFGGVGAGCGNIYFTGNGEIMAGSTTAEELALGATNIHSVNRTPSTFWQYPNALPLESVISMSPATVGLQYSRDTNRGQVVLVPATATALDPFQQAAALVWPSWAHNTSTPTAIPPPSSNFLFPSTSSTLQTQPYAASLQLFGSNYLTAAAAAAASLCQHNQQTNSTSTSSINLSLGASSISSNGLSGSSSAIGTSSRFLNMPSTAPHQNDTHKLQKHQMSLSMPMPLAPHTSLIVPPTSLKLEEFHGVSEFMTAGDKTTSMLSTSTPHHHLVVSPITALSVEAQSKTTSITSSNLIELQNSDTQALNLVRLPTPPISETIKLPAEGILPSQLPQKLYDTTTSTPLLLNHLASTTNKPQTPLVDDTSTSFKCGINEKQQLQGKVIQTASDQTVVLAPQMLDVNIQTDTPVCSDDENSSCPLAIQEHSNEFASLAASVPYSSTFKNVYAQDIHSQPLELTKQNIESITTCNNSMEETEINSDCHSRECIRCRAEENDNIKALSTVFKDQPIKSNEKHRVALPVPIKTSGREISMTMMDQNAPEDLTGLELLSNISTSSLVKTGNIICVKKEPVDHLDTHVNNESLILNSSITSYESEFDTPNISCNPLDMHKSRTQSPVVGPLGGLNLLCSLAEQRLQEEVQSSSNLFPTQNLKDSKVNSKILTVEESHSFNFTTQPSPIGFDQSFPSMEDIELPSTSANLSVCITQPVKRKKHKHSKSLKSNFANSSTVVKKSQRYNKKNKKKYFKDKRRYNTQKNDLDINDEHLQDELKSAINLVDPNFKSYKWPNPQEIFSIMETNMRMRLADITRQYRKKKRKLDEISKNKKKKCSKLATEICQHQQQLQPSTLVLGTQSVLSLNNNNKNNTNGSTLPIVSPLCDYKFGKFSNTTALRSSSSTLLNPSSFLSFTDRNITQFPPPDLEETPSVPSTAVYKSVRLEPSSLSSAIDNRNSSLRRPQKHMLAENPAPTIVCKERKVLNVSSSTLASGIQNRITCNKEDVNNSTASSAVGQHNRKVNPRDRDLVLTNEYLYRNETRVLTDMGGLFYAGIMKPLQPPDVYSITLDGERGNKSHIMSREEIFKDTILEVTPKSVKNVPVGTRLCAYWSQQYRCLYPGRAIDPECSDDRETMKDFVSVEFDDGDSGRIRLQNIRFLLSDYPIVEYNDNPLYSLGKHKKSSVKSGVLSDSLQPVQSSLIADDSIGSNQAIYQPVFDKISKHVGKKHNKGVKKKCKTAIIKGVTPTAINVADGGDGNDCSRKHHKHKKRKKHKKHHRKGFIEVENSNTRLIVVRKESDEITQLHADEGVFDTQQREVKPTNGMHKKSVKCETTSKTSAIEVQCEHLQIEEETTSNIMSEVSDEIKGEEYEVEHNNSKGSKIAAFLPDRQLWGWLGKAYRKAGVKGRARKQFYKTIKRGKETITIGDCAVFLSTGRPDRPYIGRIESMWETVSSNKVVRVRWFYHPEETIGCPKLKFPGALFESPHEDENDVQTISHHCEVLPFDCYFGKFGSDSKQYQSIYDNNDTYYLAGYYNPRLQVLKLQDDIPTQNEQNITEI